MRIGYFDCFGGASGDMILGALLASGLSPGALRAQLEKLGLAGYEIGITEGPKQGFAATKVEVRMTESQTHRHLHHITEIIDRSDLPVCVKDPSKRVFRRLAEAEAKVHGTTIEKVHFHEVGAIDAIVDVVGAVAGIHELQLDRIYCSAIPTGSGTVRCEHGLMPVPAPATAELLRGVPLAEADETGEMTTPTGAAILTTLAEGFGPLPAMRIERVGYGAGSRDWKNRPNVLRLIVGESVETSNERDEVVVLDANLDDATGEQVGHVFDALFEAGALDVFASPITMKKNRPGIQLSVIATDATVNACEDVLFRETTTFGIRRHRCKRTKLDRSSEEVETRFGPIHVKIGRRGGRVVKVSPEYEDCARASREHGVGLRDTMFEAERVWRASHEARE